MLEHLTCLQIGIRHDELLGAGTSRWLPDLCRRAEAGGVTVGANLVLCRSVDTPLDREARAMVGRLSSRAVPTERRVSFIYHGDSYDLPGGWRELMRAHYDVMYSESYDWWTFAIAFDTDDDELVSLVESYGFEGIEDLGVDVGVFDRRVVVSINCRLYPDAMVPRSVMDP